MSRLSLSSSGGARGGGGPLGSRSQQESYL